MHKQKIAKEPPPFPHNEKLFFKIYFPSKIFKIASHSRHRLNQSQFDKDSEIYIRQGL
jgi:hypothetical protein